MSKNNPTVEYRDIQGCPGYRVGNDGSVWSCLKKSYVKGIKGCRYIVGNEWKKLKPGTRRTGYLYVYIRDKVRDVHRLVLEAFVGPCPEGMECRHFPDGTKKNNNLSNLRWGTRQENVDDNIIQNKILRGEDSPKAKFTAEQIIEIRELASTGKYRANDLAKIMGVTNATIVNIVKGISWKNTGGPISNNFSKGPKRHIDTGKLTKAIISEIRDRYVPYKNAADLAKEFGVSVSTINKIVNYKYYNL